VSHLGLPRDDSQTVGELHLALLDATPEEIPDRAGQARSAVMRALLDLAAAQLPDHPVAGPQLDALCEAQGAPNPDTAAGRAAVMAEARRAAVMAAKAVSKADRNNLTLNQLATFARAAVQQQVQERLSRAHPQDSQSQVR
jgi:hypothetical protein